MQPKKSAPVVTAVVLAAGLSRRMGKENKLLLSLNGQPMVRHVVQQVLASRCQRVVVVLGYQAELVRRVLSDLPVDFVLNSNFAEGLGASVRTGANAVADGSATVVCLGDMPLVNTQIVDSLISAYKPEAGVVACQPVFEGKRGNPVLWGAGYIAVLRKLSGDEGARNLLKEAGRAVVLVDVLARGVLQDIDTPQDFAQITQTKP